MLIAILIDSLAGGGAERVMLTLAQTLTSQGHACIVLVLDDACEHDLPPKVPVFSLKIDNIVDRYFPSKVLASKLNSIEAEYGRFDLHISNLEKTNLAVAKLNLRNTLYVVHNSVAHTLNVRWLQPFKWWMVRQSLKGLSGKDVVAVSQGVAEGIARSPLIKPKSLTTIYNPLDLNEVTTLSDALDEAIPTEPYLIHVGRVARQKRHDVLFEALSKVKSPIKLVCLCKNVRKARKLAEKYGVQDRVILPGFKRNPYPWIKGAKGLVLSSDFEGFPTVLIESLSLGVNTISADCDYGPREILTGPLERWLVEPGNPNALAQKINEYIDESPSYSRPEILDQVGSSKAASRYLALLGDDFVARSPIKQCQASRKPTPLTTP